MKIKTKTIELPTFEQLTDDEKATVLTNYYDINVGYEWWLGVYDDAAEIGLKITEFEINNNRHAEGEFSSYPEVCALEILKNHGKESDSYKIAKGYFHEASKLKDDDDDYMQKNSELSEDFLKDILEEYSCSLQASYDYYTSDECIAETLIANEYTFNRETLTIDY